MIDLYFWPTPNGKKITILLEEAGIPYNIKAINIGRGDQLAPDFLKISPNGRMPAIVDHEPKGGGAPIAIFESGAIMEYLTEKSGKVLAAGTASEIQSHTMALLADGQPRAQDGRTGALSTRLAKSKKRRSGVCTAALR